MSKRSPNWRIARIRREIFRARLEGRPVVVYIDRVKLVDGSCSTGSCERKSFQRAFPYSRDPQL